MPIVDAEIRVSQVNLDREALRDGSSGGLSTGYIPDTVIEITIPKPPELPDDPPGDPVVVPPSVTVLTGPNLNTGSLPAAEPAVSVWVGTDPGSTVDPSTVDMTAILDDLDGIVAANMTLASRSVVPENHGVHLATWEMDAAPTDGEAMVLVFGPEDCGDAARKKFFRGLRLFGEGTARVLVFIDGLPVRETTLSMVEDAPHSRLVYLPRGTKGYKLIALVAVGGPLEEVQVLFDPIGTLEGA